MRALVIDADSATAEVLTFSLANAGIKVDRSASARSGIERALSRQVDVAIVDQSLPDMTGFDVCRVIRDGGDLPLILIAALPQEEIVLRAFAAGADDVMARPLRLAELVARLQAVVRRVASRQGPQELLLVARGPYQLDQSRLEVTVPGRPEPVRLTPLEAKMLGLLMVNANQVMSKARLQELIWGYQNDSSGDLLKTHIRHLRVKLEDVPSLPRYIQTISGVGYTFVCPKPSEDRDIQVGVPAAGALTLYQEPSVASPVSA